MSIIWKMRKSVKQFPCCIFCLLCLSLFCSIVQVRDILNDISQKSPAQEEAISLTSQIDPLCYIPHKAVRVWDERDFLIVFGIPSLDIPKRRWRRHMQRTTCWQFPEVATRENNYTGVMLVVYLLAKHPLNNFTLSEALVQEAEHWHDILIHPFNEGRSSTNKMKDDKGNWGMEAEIGASRKTIFWFRFAFLHFPRAPYIAKGDDDIFISVPRYLEDLRRLPRRRTYWGRYVHKNMTINTKGDEVAVRYMMGYCATLARDVVESFLSYKAMQRLVELPYSNKTEPEFIAMNMQHEDVMVGRVLQEVGFPVIYFLEGSARFNAFPSLPVTGRVVVSHKPEGYEYYKLFYHFMFHREGQKATRIIKIEPDLYFMKSYL